MRQAVKAVKAGDRSDLVKSDKLNAWTSAKLRVGAERHHAADSAEEQRLPEPDHSASRRTGSGHIVIRVHSLSTQLNTTFGRSRQARRRQQDIGGVLHVSASTLGGIRTESWS